MEYVTKSSTPKEMKKMLVKSIDSGKLILVDKDARRIGKTQALIAVARLMDIILLVNNDGRAEMMRKNNPDLKVYPYRNVLYLRGVDLAEGFLVDEDVPMETIDKILKDIPTTRLRTGFYTNTRFV